MRPFEFLAKPYSVTYAKVRALVRTCQETSKSHQNSDFLRELYLSTQTGAFYPQRAAGTHRAEGTSLLPTGKNIVSSLLPPGKTAFQRFPLSNSLTSPGFSGILALRVSRTVASQDEESPSITRQGAGEIPVKATSRKVQQRYTARFIV